MSKTKKRSICPIACTLDLIGDKWTLLVIRDLLLGKTLFKEFAQSPEKIATNILSNRLVRLRENGLVEKIPSKDYPNRDAYRMTKKGNSLRPVLKSILDWGLANIEGTRAELLEQSKRK